MNYDVLGVELVKLLSTKCPGFKIVEKKDSRLMRFLGAVLGFLRISPSFMTEVTTTVGKTIYVPTEVKADKEAYAWVLAHEIWHLEDTRWKRFYKAFLWAMPQVLALGVALTFFSWWFLLCAVFASPLPAYWRMKQETKAYGSELGMMVYGATYPYPNFMEFAADQLTKKYYYFCWWLSRARVVSELRAAAMEIAYEPAGEPFRAAVDQAKAA